MPNLSEEQINKYKEDGFVAPINVLSREEANEIKEEIHNSKEAKYIRETENPELASDNLGYERMIEGIFLYALDRYPTQEE